MILSPKEKNSSIRIGMVVYISNYDIKHLFAILGLDDKSNEAELRDACGEFCNIVAGAFKTE